MNLFNDRNPTNQSIEIEIETLDNRVESSGNQTNRKIDQYSIKKIIQIELTQMELEQRI